MAFDGSTIHPVPGVLTYTPNGGSAKSLGYTEEGVELFVRNRHEPITPEELGEMPLDWIILGGPVLCIVTGLQWDDATRYMMGGGLISGSTIVWSSNHIGKLASALNYGALAFTPDTSGHQNWTAGKAVPLFAERELRPQYRRRKYPTWSIVLGIAPPAGGGTLVTLGTS